jgi:hypothetical protein
MVDGALASCSVSTGAGRDSRFDIGHTSGKPRVDRQHEGGQQAEPPDVGGARLVHRFAILTVLGAILAAQVAWAAFLVLVAAWLIGSI